MNALDLTVLYLLYLTVVSMWCLPKYIIKI